MQNYATHYVWRCADVSCVRAFVGPVNEQYPQSLGNEVAHYGVDGGKLQINHSFFLSLSRVDKGGFISYGLDANSCCIGHVLKVQHFTWKYWTCYRAVQISAHDCQTSLLVPYDNGNDNDDDEDGKWRVDVSVRLYCSRQTPFHQRSHFPASANMHHAQMNMTYT